MVACVPFSSISRQRNAPGDRLDHGVVDPSAYRHRCASRAVGCEDDGLTSTRSTSSCTMRAPSGSPHRTRTPRAQLEAVEVHESARTHELVSRAESLVVIPVGGSSLPDGRQARGRAPAQPTAARIRLWGDLWDCSPLGSQAFESIRFTADTPSAKQCSQPFAVGQRRRLMGMGRALSVGQRSPKNPVPPGPYGDACEATTGITPQHPAALPAQSAHARAGCASLPTDCCAVAR
jgi:hypothetical protein